MAQLNLAHILTGRQHPRIVLAVVFTVLNIFPIYWMVAGSLSPIDAHLSRNVLELLIPRQLTIEHFLTVLSKPSFTRYMLNSLLIAGTTTGMTIVLASLSGYSLARLRFPGSELVSRLILLTYSVPSVLLLIPLFKAVVFFRINDTPVSLILAYTTFSLPFSVWMLRGFFISLPRELEDAAMVDGAGRVSALVRIILPLSLPGIVATALFTFILAWNEFLFALVFITSDAVRTLPIGIALTMSSETTATDWAVAMAASTMSCIPIFLIVLVLQRGLVRGITAGSTKG